MAKVTKKTEQVQKVVYEDKDVINVEMTPEEAAAVHSVLWLIEMETTGNPDYAAIKDLQDALGLALNFPISKFRFDKDHRYNNESCVYIHPRD